MSAKTGKTPYEIALSIKELMEQGVKNKVILESTGLNLQNNLLFTKESSEMVILKI